MYAYKAETPVVIDGSDSDACWDEADWHDIGVVWLPYYNAPMDEGDFEGHFKLAWDSLYLYVMAEIIDDSLSDDYVNPLQNWWEDDCLEVFIDENRSKGNHLQNNNAFAYHVSTYYDAIDMSPSGAGVNYKDNIDVVMDTIGTHKYRWELAIKNYDDTFDPNNPEASRVYLHHDKLMGFSLAYCDNDETKLRENFIGSTVMPPDHSNDNYITADYFGTMLLVDPNYTGGTAVVNYKHSQVLKVYPNPVCSYLTIVYDGELLKDNFIEIRDLTGRVLLKLNSISSNQKINVENLKNGVYTVHLSASNNHRTSIFIKQ